MKRVLGAITVVALIVFIPLSNVVSARGSKDGVDLCHFGDESEIGRVLNVSSRAASTHITMHGDVEFPFFTLIGTRSNMCELAARIWICRGDVTRIPFLERAMSDVESPDNCFLGIDELPVLWDAPCGPCNIDK